MWQRYFSISLDLKDQWFRMPMEENLENMKYIHKIMKEKGIEEDIKEWRDAYDETILREATRWGRPKILKWLLHECISDVNEQNRIGSTALHNAIVNNRIECARLLLDLGSQNLKTRLGYTPLDLAKKVGTKEMQSLLESHFHSR